MSGALPSPAEVAGVIQDAILDAIDKGNIEECITSSGHRFWLFSRTSLEETKQAIREDILRQAREQYRRESKTTFSADLVQHEHAISA